MTIALIRNKHKTSKEEVIINTENADEFDEIMPNRPDSHENNIE
tara:strand:+ start:3658 stop:3789 length:132 start_codon:yes stop_codon:yes gene_type:complete